MSFTRSFHKITQSQGADLDIFFFTNEGPLDLAMNQNFSVSRELVRCNTFKNIEEHT